jgi:hypothetical protein
MLTEKEAWLLLATLIGGAPEAMVEVFSHGSGDFKLAGLCRCLRLLQTDELISESTAHSMVQKLMWVTYFKGKVHLTTPGNWTDGVRLSFCLNAAESCE